MRSQGGVGLHVSPDRGVPRPSPPGTKHLVDRGRSRRVMPVVSKHITRWLAGIVAIAMILSATPLVADSKSAPSKVDPALLAAATSRPDAIFSVIVRGAKRQANEPKSAGRSDDLGARVAHAAAGFKGLGASVGRPPRIAGSAAAPPPGHSTTTPPPPPHSVRDPGRL